MKRYLLRHPGVARLGVILLMLIGWEIAARWFIDPMFISPPSRVLMALGSVFATPNVPAADTAAATPAGPPATPSRRHDSPAIAIGAPV